MSNSSQEGSINVEIGGRLGNQMFQYAFARALQEKYYPDYALNLCFKLTRKGKAAASAGGGSQGWENDLKLFNVRSYREVESIKLPLEQSIFAGRYFLEKRVLKKPDLEGRAQGYLQRHGIYASRASHFIPAERSDSKFIYVRGRFEAHEYFDNIREKLLDEFRPIAPITSNNERLMDNIQSTESVRVTIRRGDFYNRGNENFQVCDQRYFYEAMHSIRKSVPDATFFVFSDDVDLVKREFHFPFEVEYETGSDGVDEKIRLMSACKHFVISNSTFSWWVQYLSRNDDKIVCVPSIWRRGGEDCSGLYLPYMRRIAV